MSGEKPPPSIKFGSWLSNSLTLWSIARWKSLRLWSWGIWTTTGSAGFEGRACWTNGEFCVGWKGCFFWDCLCVYYVYDMQQIISNIFIFFICMICTLQNPLLCENELTFSVDLCKHVLEFLEKSYATCSGGLRTPPLKRICWKCY